MPFKHGTSIFSRNFKKTFNQKKYMNYIAKEGDEYTHMSFYSMTDMTIGRIGLTIGITFMFLTSWFAPDYIHETFGHYKPPPSHEKINKVLKGKEYQLNTQLIEREHAEHKLESYTEIFKAYE